MFNDNKRVLTTGARSKGVKIVDNPYSKRESDIFNTKTVVKPRSSSLTYDDKMRLVERQQNFVDSQIRVKFIRNSYNNTK